jgi:type II secretory pathway pseudopilin PulG
MRVRGGRGLLGLSVTVIVLTAIALGVYLIGSPGEARLVRMDERRIEDLQSARQAIDRFWTAHGHLPPTLDSLEPENPNRVSLHDPATGDPYGYRAVADSSYELCASFTHPSSDELPGRVDDAWFHPSGRHCFALVAGRVLIE